MSPKMKFPKLKCHQNLNITKTEMSPKLKYHLEWNVTETKMSQKLKCHQTEMHALKIHIHMYIYKYIYIYILWTMTDGLTDCLTDWLTDWLTGPGRWRYFSNWVTIRHIGSIRELAALIWPPHRFLDLLGHFSESQKFLILWYT